MAKQNKTILDEKNIQTTIITIELRDDFFHILSTQKNINEPFSRSNKLMNGKIINEKKEY